MTGHRLFAVPIIAILFFTFTLTSPSPTEADTAKSADEITKEINSAYNEGDYELTVKLLKGRITKLEEKDLSSAPDVYQVLHQLAFIYAKKLDKNEAAITIYKKASELDLKDLEKNKLPALDDLFISALYHELKDYENERKYLLSFIDSSDPLNSTDDVMTVIKNELSNIANYRLDTLNAKTKGRSNHKPSISKLKAGDMSLLSPWVALILASISNPFLIAESDTQIYANLDEFIMKGGHDFSSMFVGYSLIVNQSMEKIHEPTQRAFEIYRSMYPESYFTLSLSLVFYRFYMDSGMEEKARALMEEAEEVAKKRDMAILFEPEERFSSPEKTFAVYKKALIAGDLETAIECLHIANYSTRQVLNYLGKEKVMESAKKMKGIKKVFIYEDTAEYHVMKSRGDKVASFPIQFHNTFGEWRISAF